MAKLTEAQKRALAALPCKITMWGGKPFSGMPQGIRSRSTLLALCKLGLVSISHEMGNRESWSLTEAGRAALSAANTQDKGGEGL